MPLMPIHTEERPPISPGWGAAGMSPERTDATRYTSGPLQHSRNIWGMKTHRDTSDTTRTPQWDKPIKFDYSQARKDTGVNRQHTGFVPQMFEKHPYYSKDLNPFGYPDYEKYYIPASQAYAQGYFDDPNAPGKSYFETNPEFKTFFPYEPDYAGLAALNEFEKSGKGFFDESTSRDIDSAYGYYTSQHPYNIGGPWIDPRGEKSVGARPHSEDISRRIAMNLSPEADDWAKHTYTDYYGYPTTDRSYKDTAIHEMKHHWLQGNVNPEATDLYRSYKGSEYYDPWHDEINLGEAMWSPNISAYGLADLDQAKNFMKMHRLGKSQFLDAQQPTYAGYNTGGIVSLVI